MFNTYEEEYAFLYIEIFCRSWLNDRLRDRLCFLCLYKILQFSQKVMLMFQNSVFQPELLAIEETVH